MLAALPLWLQVADFGALLVGTVLTVAWIHERRRDRRPWPTLPHADAPSGPSLAAAVLFLVAYFLAQTATVSLLATRYSLDELQRPDSFAWHALSGALNTAKLGVLALALLIWPALRRIWSAPVRRSLQYALGGLLIALPIVSLLAEVGRRALESAGYISVPHPVLQQISAGSLHWLAVAQLAFGAVVVAALAEEILFRVILLDALVRETGRPLAACVVSSVIFGIVHLPMWEAVIPLAMLGLILAYVRLRAGFWACVAVHALFNARSFFYTLLGASG